MAKCNICILTYRRPQLLLDCLASLEKMETLPSVEIIVTVIENDAEQKVLATLESFSTKFRLPLNILCEPVQGIPIARNTAVEHSIKTGADYIIFIDDDETVAKDWFVTLFNYSQQHKGEAVIHGEVVGVYPPGTPEHISGLFKSKQRPSGKRLTSCATNNVIFPISIVSKLGLRFDTSMPLAGGTDTKFFTEAVSKGVKIYSCAEAVVFESIAPNRATLNWMIVRKYRAGITDAWRDRYNGKSWISIFLKMLIQFVTNLLRLFVFGIINQKKKRNLSILKT